MEETLAQWLQKRCEEERLTLREAAAKCGLSHSTLADIVRSENKYPRPETIRKLAQGFGGDALEEHLFVLAGYKSAREEPGSEALAQVIDKIRHFSDAQVKIMIRFADFLIEIEKGSKPRKQRKP